MRRILRPACVFFAAAGLSGNLALASTETLDFENAPYSVFSPIGWQNALPDGYVEKGMAFTNGCLNGSGGAFYVYPPGAARYTGSRAIDPCQVPNINSTMSIGRADGERFDLKSLKLLPQVSGQASTIFIQGFRPFPAGPVTEVATSTANFTGTVVTLSNLFTGLIRVEITRTTAAGARYQLDDITIYKAPRITVGLGTTVTESAGEAFVDLSVQNPDADVPLNYTISDGTAVQPGDYTRPNNSATGVVTIPSLGGTTRLRIPIVNNTTTEPLEQFTVAFSGQPSGATYFGNNTTSTIRIGDDDVTTFATWMSAHGLTTTAATTTADPNGDGISNLESWLYRINPAGPSPEAWLARRATYFTTATNFPGLRLTVPAAFPTDVRLIFEESTGLNTWSEQARRSGFGTGSLWSGPGASRVVENSTVTSRTISLPGSSTRNSRSKAFYRMKYELISVID